ncbi:PEGA domain-containing protein [Luteitalea sp.]|uniref:PEGA domain-containing protein n=1 Tax=Luteitalea sp. TaxID=2004800 RepID=UPI0037C5D8F7
MRSLEAPESPRGPGLSLILLLVALVIGAAAWYATTRSPEPTSPTAVTPVRPSDQPTTGNAAARGTERPAPDTAGTRPTARPGTAAASRPSAKAEPTAEPTPAAAARELRVTSDVPGAYVFVDRKYLGTTPLSTRDVTPGQHQINVQIEGRPPVVRTVDVLESGPTDVAVSLAAPPPSAAPAIDATVAVVHQHAMGSCEGTLRATPDGFRYVTAHKDAFTLPYTAVEQFSVDYSAKRLRLKQRGGRTWNFGTTAETADPLFVFHRDVDAARPR